MLPLILERNNLFNQDSREAVFVILALKVARVVGVTKVPLSITRIVLAPRLEKGLVLLGSHSFIQSLIELCLHPYKRKMLVKKGRKKKKKKEEERSSIDKLNTYSFVFLNLYVLQDKSKGL